MIDLKQNFELDDVTLINFIFLTDKEKNLVREWRNHENIRKWMYNDHLISSVEHQEFIENLKNENKNVYWIVKNKGNEYLGTISLQRIDFKNKNAYLGIYANPLLNKRGKGKILITSLKQMVFRVVNLHTLKPEVLEDNDKGIYFYKSSGFNEEGRLKEFVFKDNQWKDVIIMGLLNPEGDENDNKVI